jgi:hypothetical protein
MVERIQTLEGKVSDLIDDALDNAQGVFVENVKYLEDQRAEVEQLLEQGEEEKAARQQVK